MTAVQDRGVKYPQMDGNTTHTAERWLQSPLVAHAARKADLDPLETMTVLLDMMNTLEDACPGVPFAEILSAATPSADPTARAAVAGMLLERGLSPDEVDSTVGPDARLRLAEHMIRQGSTLKAASAAARISPKGVTNPDLPVKRHAQRTAEALHLLGDLQELRAEGLTVAEAAARLGISERRAYRYLAGKMPGVNVQRDSVPRWLQIARHKVECGKAELTAEEFGLSSVPYVHACVSRARQEGRL